MPLQLDKDGVPRVYKCPKCGFEHQLSLKEQILDIIYTAKWHFSVPEHYEVDEYFIEEEDEDRVVNLIVRVTNERR